MQFLTIELHRTVLESCCTQFLCEGIEFDKLLCILTLIRILLRCWGSRLTSTILNTIVLEYLLYLLIGIATITLNDSMCQMPLLDICLIVELEDNTITEFLLIRTQRTDKVTEPFWQHRDSTIHQINTCGTIICLFVYSRTLTNIVTYVSDMDTNLPQATIKLTDTECIVEILRILWVDSTCKHLAEILTTIYLLRCNGSINLICSILHVLRIFIRQIILRKDSMHLGIVLTCLTKDINY